MSPTFEEAVMRRVGLLACEVCNAPGPHRIIRIRDDGASAVCTRCGDPQVARQIH